MIFTNDVRYVKIWDVQHFEKHIKLRVSTGDKQQDGSYKNSSWFLTLVGQAFEQGRHLKTSDTITVNKGKMENIYVKDKNQTFLNWVAFDIEAPSYTQSDTHINNQEEQFNGFQTDIPDDECPF
jgi:hypothetical protein